MPKDRKTPNRLILLKSQQRSQGEKPMKKRGSPAGALQHRLEAFTNALESLRRNVHSGQDRLRFGGSGNHFWVELVRNSGAQEPIAKKASCDESD